MRSGRRLSLPTTFPCNASAWARRLFGQSGYPKRSISFEFACFGLLDQPVLLSEGLVYLAMAQEVAGRRADVVTTLNRFLEVERRFGVYARSSLDEATRAEFQALLLSRVSAEAVAAVPTLSGLVRRQPVPAPGRKDP